MLKTSTYHVESGQAVLPMMHSCTFTSSPKSLAGSPKLPVPS
jgi:hypothetical protein